METRQNSKKKVFGGRERACLGKVKHKSMLAANYVFDRMRGKGCHQLEVYPCPYCKFFHIGNNNWNKK